MTSNKLLVRELNNQRDEAVAFAVLLLGNSGRPATVSGVELERAMMPILQAASRGRKKVAATVRTTEGRNTAGEV